MSHSAEFANHFARLTSLFVRQSGEVDDQKQHLMAALESAKHLVDAEDRIKMLLQSQQ